MTNAWPDVCMTAFASSNTRACRRARISSPTPTRASIPGVAPVVSPADAAATSASTPSGVTRG